MSETFSAQEKAAMKAAVKERKAAQKGAELEAACLAAITEMDPADRALAEKVHGLVQGNTTLAAKTWYGMPAYTDADGKVVLFFKPAAKFKQRYATVGFEEAARLDDGALWATSYAVTAIGAAEEKMLTDLIRRAAG